MYQGKKIIDQIVEAVGIFDYKWCSCGNISKKKPDNIDISLMKTTQILTLHGVEVSDLVEMVNRCAFVGADYDGQQIRFDEKGCVSIERICHVLPMWLLVKDANEKNHIFQNVTLPAQLV